MSTTGLAVSMQSMKPLTPALSPSDGEREGFDTLVERSLLSDPLRTGANGLPLPFRKGEGRGEGSRPLHSCALAAPSRSSGLASTAPDCSRPDTRPKKSAFRLVREVLDHGGPGYLQFAITNICNAKCDFCGFAMDRFDPKQRRSVTLQEACDVIDICVKNHIGYLLFVGGEPLVHRDLRGMVRYAA